MSNVAMRVIWAIGVVVAIAVKPSGAVAQTVGDSTWPNRPIRLILPSAAGGAGDIASRLIAQVLSQRLGQQIVVENRPGAAGVVGSTAIARAAPDGYTIGLLTASTHAASAALSVDLPYKADADFAPIAMIGDLPVVIAAYPGLPAKNIAEFVAAAKAKPGSIANGWAAMLPYLAALLFSQRTGIELNHIPYKGSGQASMDLVEGRIQVQFGTISPILALLREGKIKPLAVTSAKRSEHAAQHADGRRGVAAGIRRVALACMGRAGWYARADHPQIKSRDRRDRKGQDHSGRVRAPRRRCGL